MLTDRSRLISEYIYNPVIKARPLAYGMDDWLYMVGRFVQGQHLIIYCKRAMNDLVESFVEDEQLGGVFENLFSLASRYERVVAMFQLLFDIAESPSRIIVCEFASARDWIFQNVKQYIEEVSA